MTRARDDVDGALRMTDAVLAEAPDDLGLNLARLQLLQELNDNDGLGDQLARMVERFPETIRFKEVLAQWQLDNGDQASAETTLREIAAQQPDNADAAINLVRFVVATQGVAAGRREFAALIERTEDPEVRARLQIGSAELDYRDGREDDAYETLDAVVEAGVLANDARLMLASLALAEERATDARALLDVVLEDDPDNVAALGQRARLLINDGKPQDAIIDVRRAIGLAPDNTSLILIEAAAQERLGNLDLAGERLATAARNSGFDPAVTRTYAQFLVNRGQLTAAEAALSESMRRHPDNRDTLIALADIRVRLADWSGADAIADALERLGAENEEVSGRIRAATLSAQGRLDESIILLEEMNLENPESAGALSALVSNYVRNGETDRAVALLDNTIEDMPDNIPARALRAELYYLEGDVQKTEETLRDIIALQPMSPVGYTMMASFALRTDQRDAALETLRVGLSRLPQSPPLLQMKAQISETERDFDTAIEAYATLYASNPSSLVVANNYASLLAEHREDDAESIATAVSVAQQLRGSEIPELQDTYGWIAFLDGRAEEALRYLEPAATARPDNALIRYHRGRVLVELGQTARAREDLEAALAIDPDFPKAASARAVLETLPETVSD